MERGGVFVFSIITYYEVRRGLLFKDAHGQLERFKEYCSRGTIVPLNEEIVELASALWAKRRKETGGDPPDHDTLIAATALIEKRTLATANTRDFGWVPGLQISNWRSM